MPSSTRRRADPGAIPASEPSRPLPVVPNRPSPAHGPAVSSPATGQASQGSWIESGPVTKGPHDGHALVAVGPGLSGSWLVMGGYGMNPLPHQPAKIHCPPARSDTLTRPRLNTWLDRAATGRLGLIIAEAGFGKTTLLGDWARHTDRATAWYRLEADDRDWLTFIRHLVASGRELNPDFAPETYALLLALGAGGPTRKDLIAAIAREMSEFAATVASGFTLILDDYHQVDGFTETEPIVRGLLDLTGPGFSIVIASRAQPGLPISRLRSRGGLMSLTGRDLRFDEAETASLFRDAYHHPLDDDVIGDLCRRTDGWAALLGLVRARVEEDVDARSLVARLSAIRGDAYDFIAEELMAALPEDLTHFLSRASILSVIEPMAAALATGWSPSDAQSAMLRCERLGLISRPDRDSPHRFHPLVREFLQSRLHAQIGPLAVRDLHRQLAELLPEADWYGRAWHLLHAGDASACGEVVDAAIERIVAEGDLERASSFLTAAGGDPQRGGALVLRSKIDFSRGDLDRALDVARRAVAISRGTALEGMCLINLGGCLSAAGVADEAVAINEQALELPLSAIQRYAVVGSLALMQASQVGDLQTVAGTLRQLAMDQEGQGLRRYAGLSWLNYAIVLVWSGDAREAFECAGRAEVLLGGRSQPSVERVSATLLRAIALAQLGRIHEARTVAGDAATTPNPLSHAERAIETGRLELEFGSLSQAEAALATFDPTHSPHTFRGVFSLLSGELALRKGDIKGAAAAQAELVKYRCADVAGELRTRLLRARLALRQADPRATDFADDCLSLASQQRTDRGKCMAAILGSLAAGRSPEAAMMAVGDRLLYCWSLLAEELSANLHLLSERALEGLRREAERRPERWSSALRLAAAQGGPSSGLAAGLLAAIGSDADARWMRELAAARKEMRPHAAVLVRRVAPRIRIEDLGVVEVFQAERTTPLNLRRKVLALLCYLASRPRMAAGREETIEALWPDLTPEAGTNSLHQAVYSLRRGLDPDFKEAISANYIQVDGDVVSLNADLVSPASRRCWQLLQSVRSGHPEAFDELETLYTHRFALTFAYDDWASTYRENLHAAVLAAGEAEMVRSRRAGLFDRAIRIGHSILTVDPQADAIELELLRAYKHSGRHAAAAEQYAHYAAYVREELAANPPAFDEI